MYYPKKWIITVILSLFTYFCSTAQDLAHIEDSLLAEGTWLYKSEITSWYGTDAFIQQHGNDGSDVGGYFSYPDDSVTKCIFFSKGDAPEVIGTIAFNGIYSLTAADVNLAKRTFTDKEKTIYQLRQNALDIIGKDTMFKNYKNANLNLVPFVTDKVKRVYVITGPQVNGVVLLGNDYLLEFNPDNTIASKKTLHKSLIQIDYGNGDKPSIAGIHSHLPEYSQFITATDICTCMLYAPLTNWNTHYVMSKDYVSVFDLKKNALVILTMDAWKRMSAGKKQ